jgi:outer membrane protein OmpA-like peptidoglycan-associated protein
MKKTKVLFLKCLPAFLVGWFNMKIFLSAFFCTLTLFVFSQNGGKKGALVSVKVLNEELEGISVHIEVIDSDTKEQFLKQETDNNGDTEISLNPNQSYIVFFTAPDYLYRSVNVVIPDSAGYRKTLKDVVMEKMAVGKRTILQNVTFDLYQKILIDESLPDFDRVVKLMTDMPKLRVEIGGHTDNFGSLTYSLKVSEERAQAVVDMLISRGIDKSRLEFKGYGSSLPIATNFTEEGRLLNNRVEFKVLQLDFTPQTAAEIKKTKKDKTKTAKKEEPTDNGQQGGDGTGDKSGDTMKVEKPINMASEYLGAPDSLLKMDYKGKFIADKSPLAFSTVNLLNEEGKVFQTTKTDKNGSFEFTGVPAAQELKFELDSKETKQYKKIFLADTTGAVLKELDKIDGEFVLSILPSEKIKLGTVYLEDPQLKLKKFKGKAENAFIMGRAVDDSGNPIKADVEAIDYLTGLSVQKVTCNSSGEFSITIMSGKNYDIVVSKTGYSFQSINVEIPRIKGFERNLKDIPLQKVEAGKKIVLNNIFFDVGAATLRKESYAELGRALKLFNSMQTLSVEIDGHTDNVGSSKSNLKLSEQRAKSVMDYLIENGVDKKRLQYKGFGASQPVASNKTEEGKQQNRRTEFKVLEVNLTEEAEAQRLAEENTGSENGGTEESTNSGDPSSRKLKANLQKYDTDHNGIISYEEILSAIDSYFENYPKGNAKVKEELSSLFDFYFEK